MRETPAEYASRTGAPPPASRITAKCTELGSSPRPLADDEPCPTLYRDVGPQALGAFLDGTLTRYGPERTPWLYLRDASLPSFSRCADELGLLVFLQPLAIGPWRGNPGIWVSEPERTPPRDTVAFLPGGEDVHSVDGRLADVADVAALREALGGAEYDARVEASTRALRVYLEGWELAERVSRPLRAALDGPSTARAVETRALLASAGLTEPDLRAPWYHLTRDRRAEVLERLAGLAPLSAR